jgi:hypothetical protein
MDTMVNDGLMMGDRLDWVELRAMRGTLNTDVVIELQSMRFETFSGAENEARRRLNISAGGIAS